jgi:Flp pilus assembly protein TadD
MKRKTLKALGMIAILSLGGCANQEMQHHDFKADPMHSADQARQNGDIATAVRQYREVIREDSHNKEAYLKLGYALLDGNYTNEAYKAFKEAEEKFGKCGDSHRGMGAVLLVMDRPEEAIQQYNHALDINPQDARAINGQGIGYELLGHTKKAQAAYRAAMELDPSNPKFENNYALSLTLDGQGHEGVHIFERLARSPNATPRVRQNLALAYGLSGDISKARHVGRMDLSDAMVKTNLNYIRAIKGMQPNTSRYANVLPTNLEQNPLDAARTWHGG